MSDFQKFLSQQLEDQEFRAYYDEMEVAASISKAMVAGRIRLNLSQKELAKRVGMNQAEISRLENCEGNPSVKTLKRIASALGMKVQLEFVPVASEKEGE